MTFFRNFLMVGVVSVFAMSFVGTVQAQEETNLGDILVRFCNNPDAIGGTKALNTTATAGEPKEICLYINNQGATDAQVYLNFVDGTITADADQKKACQPEGTKGQFGQYVTIDQNTFEVEAGSTLQTTAYVTFPAGYAGMNYGCVTYQLLDEDTTSDEMFNVVTRRANFVDILVDGNIELGIEVMAQENNEVINNLSDSNNIFIYFDETTQQHVARVVVRNVGNIAQEVTMSATFNDLFQKHDLAGLTKKILPNQSAYFVFPIEDILPFYDGPMGIEVTASHVPVFEFNSDRITPEMRVPQTVILHASFFVVPWKVIILLLVILAMVWAASRGNGKAPAKKTTKRKSTRKTSTTKKTSTSSQKDNLTKLDGIGPKLQELLNKAGIKSYKDLAASKVADLRKILKDAGPRYAMYNPGDWKRQAALARDGKWDELKELQKSLKK